MNAKNLPTVGRALVEAGVKLPTQMQLVWTWLKDHPRKRIIDVRSAVPIPQSGVSSVITQMRQRGMIKRELEQGLRTKKMIPYYTAVGDVYELLPEPKVGAGETGHTRRKWSHPVPVEPKREIAVIDQGPATSKIDTLTIGEARKLYLELKKFFG